MWISFFFLIFKLIITEHKSHNFLPIFFRASPSSSISEDVQFTVTKKDNIIGWRIWTYCLFYVGEQQPISFFFNLSSCKPEHNIMENCSTFFNQISRRFLFLFSQSSSLLLHSYVCETPRPITHPHTRCPEKKRVEAEYIPMT